MIATTKSNVSVTHAEISNTHRPYSDAALDAIASLRLHEVLKGALDQKERERNITIPEAWYTFNTKAGEPTRVKRAEDGTEITWRTMDCPWFAGSRFQGYP